MSSFKEMWRQGGEEEQGDWHPPVGTHDAIVVEASAFESAAGDGYAKTVLALSAPGTADDGRQWDHLMGFKTPRGAGLSRSQLALYGVDTTGDLENIEELDAKMAKLPGTRVTVTCKARDGDGVWTNITGSRSARSDVPVDVPVAATGQATSEDDDDVPF